MLWKGGARGCAYEEGRAKGVTIKRLSCENISADEWKHYHIASESSEKVFLSKSTRKHNLSRSSKIEIEWMG